MHEEHINSDKNLVIQVGVDNLSDLFFTETLASDNLGNASIATEASLSYQPPEPNKALADFRTMSFDMIDDISALSSRSEFALLKMLQQFTCCSHPDYEYRVPSFRAHCNVEILKLRGPKEPAQAALISKEERDTLVEFSEIFSSILERMD